MDDFIEIGTMVSPRYECNNSDMRKRRNDLFFQDVKCLRRKVLRVGIGLTKQMYL
jgi:hypothetical protein